MLDQLHPVHLCREATAERSGERQLLQGRQTRCQLMAAEAEPLQHPVKHLVLHLMVQWALGVIVWPRPTPSWGWGLSLPLWVDCVRGSAVERAEVVQCELVEEVSKAPDVVGGVGPLQPPHLGCDGLQQDFSQVLGARGLEQGRGGLGVQGLDPG